jgi:hypothetical protein
MQRLTDNELDALEAAHKAATPGEWAAHRNTVFSDLRVGDSFIGDFCASVFFTGGNDDQQLSFDNANIAAIAHNALPALLAEVRELRRLTTPEPIGEKHKDGNWWLVWAPGAEQWMKCRWLGEYWGKSGTMREQLFHDPTHALPLPEPPAARGEE